MIRAQPNRSLAPQRHEEILHRLDAEGVVFVADVARHFDVSHETVRRDLKALAARGALELTHGGATRLAAVELGLARRAGRNAEAKANIGRRAAAMVADGMVVLLDAGTTTAAVAAALAGRHDLTIVTTSLPIALELCHRPGLRVQIAGGTLNPGDEASEGPEVLATLERFRFDLAFVSAGGVSPEGGVTDFTPMGAETRGRMIAVANRGYFVIDATKFGVLTPCRIPGQDRAAGILTDRAPTAELGAAVAARGLKLIVT